MTNHDRVAIAGCGYWGINLVRVFNQLGALQLVCDPIAENRQRASQVAPDAETTADFADALASNVRAIVIATPAETHFALAKQALEAGKDVFVEKPLALTYDDGARLVEMAANHERILMVGHVLEYHPGVVKLQELVTSGELGEIRYISTSRLSLGKVRNEENVLWSFAPHDIALILRLMRQQPTEVAAVGGNYLRHGIADMVVATLRFNEGVRAHIFVSWLNPFKEQRIVVVGSQRMAVYDDVAKDLSVLDQRVDIVGDQPVVTQGPSERIEFPDEEPLKRECEAFVTAIATRQPPRSDGRSGLRVLEVLQAAQDSLTLNGIPVSLAFSGTPIEAD